MAVADTIHQHFLLGTLPCFPWGCSYCFSSDVVINIFLANCSSSCYSFTEALLWLQGSALCFFFLLTLRSKKLYLFPVTSVKRTLHPASGLASFLSSLVSPLQMLVRHFFWYPSTSFPHTQHFHKMNSSFHPSMFLEAPYLLSALLCNVSSPPFISSSILTSDTHVQAPLFFLLSGLPNIFHSVAWHLESIPKPLCSCAIKAIREFLSLARRNSQFISSISSLWSHLLVQLPDSTLTSSKTTYSPSSESEVLKGESHLCFKTQLTGSRRCGLHSLKLLAWLTKP